MHDAAPKQNPCPVIEFRSVTVAPVSHRFGAVSEASFALGPGELAMINVAEGRENTPLGHAAEGLLVPEGGQVLFLGEDWAAMHATRQAAQRGRIRRVFEHYGWITNLDIIENVCLAEWHHGRRPPAEVADEAHALARRFGLERIPEGRPTRSHAMILRKLEWVRAFMGTPALMVLERPLRGAPKADAPLLFEAVCEAVNRGTSVLWMTDEDRAWDYPAFVRAQRFRMHGERLMAA
jgi:phospholipid/cholesterol/gamma-HCH transport system ATP-binding protein